MKNQNDINFINTLYSQENAKIEKKIILLFFLIVIFFISAIVWAFYAEVDELARGSGKVIPSEKIQTIQSLDGGIISDILVSEGDKIKRGQALMKIDTTRFQASLEENQNIYNHLLVTRIRLLEESKIDLDKEIPNLDFPEELKKKVNGFALNDEILFQKRVSELKSTIKILDDQYEQKKQELVETKSQMEQLRKRLLIIREEMDTIKRLVDKGSKSIVELLNIRKEYNQLEGEYISTKLSIPRLKLAIQEFTNRKEERIRKFKSEVFNELQKLNTEINKYESKLVSAQDKIEKTVLVSPVNGIVKQININTIGGVVRSGVDLIEIVPNSETLLVEVKIDPKDIAFINPSQEAVVKLTAYDFSIYGGLEGKIVEISADSIKDEDSKENRTYYKVVIKTNKNHLEKNGEKLPIIPGMIASVDIKTGKKTILDFILKPILKTKQNALHER
ncbi:HlyD family type I secretion periplasmic adaptor subunit [Halarcobacter bivalviorum]|uniref:Secretion protein HylD n=1 Tax=Halarcobacter bivalviorum TaxID=663364 RepID=A0AAX2A5V3_9BACT|nr:HlyD family type I secretion periplasmic adaptor subunit [Halarcobacter bivalviorum]AXH12921.1 type I secretion system membrane fusion protein, HlyD family [Halarcobacter bivalviorum]RXK08845.1 secretion protein HylD [Halarcobacter bivalviorum]